MNRRQFLTGVATAALAPTLPPLPVAALPIAPPPPPAPALLTFIVGTPGEFDWRPVFARTAEEAFEERFGGCFDDDEEPDINEYVTRVKEWDGKAEEELTPAAWLKQGFGYCCCRCGDECYGGDGGATVGDEAVCEQCLTLADKIQLSATTKYGRGDLIDELVERLADQGEQATRELLQKEKVWELIELDHWPEALALAGEYL